MLSILALPRAGHALSNPLCDVMNGMAILCGLEDAFRQDQCYQYCRDNYPPGTMRQTACRAVCNDIVSDAIHDEEACQQVFDYWFCVCNPLTCIEIPRG